MANFIGVTRFLVLPSVFDAEVPPVSIVECFQLRHNRMGAIKIGRTKAAECLDREDFGWAGLDVTLNHPIVINRNLARVSS